MKNLLAFDARVASCCRIAFCGFASVLVLGWTEPLFGADADLRWRWSQPRPFGGNIQEITEVAGITIAVAERGQVYTSEGRISWRPWDLPTAKDLRAVSGLGTRIIITGQEGTVIYGDSPDALQVLDLGTPDWLEDVAASSSMAVAVGDNAAIYTSTTGEAWDRRNVTFGEWLRGVAFSPSRNLFVAVGDAGRIATSQNGISWSTPATPTSEALNRVAWVGDRFWAVGDQGVILSSPTGASWSLVDSGTTNRLRTVSANGNSILVAGDNELRLFHRFRMEWLDQTDPAKPSPAPVWRYLSAFWDGAADSTQGEYVVAGRTGVFTLGAPDLLGLDYDWAVPFKSPRNWLWDVHRVESIYTAVGNRANLLTSVNGVKWDLEQVPDEATNTVFLGVGGSTNGLVTVGNGGAILFSPNDLVELVVTNSEGLLETNLVSSLGIVWHVTDSPTTNDLQGITLFGDEFVVTGNGGAILTSPDGTNWTEQASPTANFLSSVEAFPDGLVAVGKQGTILTSGDGRDWALQGAPVSDWIFRVRHLEGLLVAVGQNGTILTSTDGILWTPRASGTTRWLTDVERIGELWFICGTQGALLTSTNGLDWTDTGTATHKSLYALAAHEGQLVTVGVEGVILRSPVEPVLEPVNILAFEQDPPFDLFLFGGRPDQQFMLQHAKSLASPTDWQDGPLLEILSSDNTLVHLQLTDTNAPAQEFFQTKLKP